MNWTPEQVAGQSWACAVAGDGGGRVSVVELAIDLLKTDNASGYHSVFKVASNTKPWQAKVYLRPKTQRNLGSFATRDAAARQVIKWMFKIIPIPPSPLQDRNARGAGRKKRDRRKGELCPVPALPSCCLALLTAQSPCAHRWARSTDERVPRY